MHAEIIAIGDEITSGQLLDTNTPWLSQRLEELGVRVLYQTTVGDTLEPMAAVFGQALDRSDLVLATGGLGPTADDLTRAAIARATGRRLLANSQAMEHIRDMFARRKRPMPKRNEVQAMFPEGSRMIANPHGTAPGIALTVQRAGRSASRLFALPGVPVEMKEMWYQTVAGRLRAAGVGGRIVRHRNINCFGLGESQIEAMLPDLIRRGRVPTVGITASKTTIILRIAAEGATEEECDAAMEPTVATIHKCLGKLVFGEGDDGLEDAVTRLLRQQGKTLATAEWGTGGMVAEWMASVEEAHGYYLGGTVVAGPAALQHALDISAELLVQHTATSAEVAAAMAEHCRRRFGADLALAVSRFPRFAPEAAAPKPFYLALATADGTRTRSRPFAGHPALLKIFSAKRALNLARLALLETDSS